MASLGGTLYGLLGNDQWGDMTERQVQFEQQKEMSEYLTKNSASWNVEGLKKAGLNPVLAATGGLQPTSAGAVASGKTGSGGEVTNAAKLIAEIAKIVAIAGG